MQSRHRRPDVIFFFFFFLLLLLLLLLLSLVPLAHSSAEGEEDAATASAAPTVDEEASSAATVEEEGEGQQHHEEEPLPPMPVEEEEQQQQQQQQAEEQPPPPAEEDTAAPCTCYDGVNERYNPIPPSDTYCGYMSCGVDHVEWECTRSGWRSTGMACSKSLGSSQDANAKCECLHGVDDRSRPIPPSETFCGYTVCGVDQLEWKCTQRGWVNEGLPCRHTHHSVGGLTDNTGASVVMVAPSSSSTPARQTPAEWLTVLVQESTHHKEHCRLEQLPYPLRAVEGRIAPGQSATFRMYLHQEGDLLSDIAWHFRTQRRHFYSEDLFPYYDALIARLRKATPERQLLAIDAGANVGIHSLYLASIGVEVHAFEPTPVTCNLLRCSVVASGAEFLHLIHVYEAGIDNVVQPQSRLCMTRVAKNWGGNFLTSCTSNNAKPVGLVSLDSVWEHALLRRRVDMLKIDVEGFEWRAIQGAAEMLRQAPPYLLIVEYAPLHLHRAGLDEPHLLIQTIEAAGYRFVVAIALTDTAVIRMTTLDEVFSPNAPLFFDMVFEHSSVDTLPTVGGDSHSPA